MKDKIIEFSNGIFAYERPRLNIEPESLNLFFRAGESVRRGSFVVSSSNEKRIKGFLHTRMPGLKLKKTNFFARAARFEFEYADASLRPGKQRTGTVYLETDAGEYELPVLVQMEAAAPEEERKEQPLPEAEEEKPAREAPVFRKGRGRREEWINGRRCQWIFARFQILLEKERRGACRPKEAVKGYRALVDELAAVDKESPAGPILEAYVRFREGLLEEAGWLLRKYERSRLFQQRDVSVRALFLYVNSLVRDEPSITEHAVVQLQKLHLKNPQNWLPDLFLLDLDPQLKEKTRSRYLILERQFRSGARNRLLYQEGWKLLRDDPALFTKLDGFTVQVFAWAAGYGFLTAELAQKAAEQASCLKKWSPLVSGLLKACYQINPSKETVGAVASMYIRGNRTDQEAFVWYQKGVELDAKITNLYEYFMYALPEDYAQLLPRPVLLYFAYHNTLTGRQKTMLYCNLIRYGDRKDSACEAHYRQLQDFLLAQLKAGRLNEDLAWLYGRCLRPETLDAQTLYTLTELLFLRKLTCPEKRIRQVEVAYEQLQKRFVAPLSGGTAYVPIYTPGARITLLDEAGNRYCRSVPYDVKRVLIEPAFLQICIQKVKDHIGLNLYQLDGKGPHRLTPENVELAWRILDEESLDERWRQKLKLELLKYERRQGHTEILDERLMYQDIHTLDERGQAEYIEGFILAGRDREAVKAIKETGCRETDPKLLALLFQRRLETGSAEELLPMAWQIFDGGVCTEELAAFLAGQPVGATAELLEVWKACASFGIPCPELEEQLVAQALFTERKVSEVFPAYRSMEGRGGETLLCAAYLNYLSWLDFVKEEDVPEELFACLEQRLLWEDRVAPVAALSYLRQLSLLLLLSDRQRRLARRLAREPFLRRRQFAFWEKLAPWLDEEDAVTDQTVVEYRCNPRHKVVLHYVLEYHGKKHLDYVTEQVYPVMGGVFVRSFILFYGERLTWFFTESGPDGTEKATTCGTLENRRDKYKGDGKYERLCRMQRALDFGQERNLKRMMTEYAELNALVQEQFRRK